MRTLAISAGRRAAAAAGAAATTALAVTLVAGTGMGGGAGCAASRRGEERGSGDAERANEGGGAETALAKAARPSVMLFPEGRQPVRVWVEIARTDAERARGLMWRRELADDAGMLFLFEQEELQSFWMKNTLIPLDMIFIRGDLTVAGIVENAAPLSLESRSVGVPSKYVLEVNGGWARRHGVEAGTPVVLLGVETTPGPQTQGAGTLTEEER